MGSFDFDLGGAWFCRPESEQRAAPFHSITCSAHSITAD
jgi:hypothetical protein